MGLGQASLARVSDHIQAAALRHSGAQSLLMENAMDYLWLYETATLRLMLADAAHVREKCNDADARFIAHEVCLSIQREIVGRGEKL